MTQHIVCFSSRLIPYDSNAIQMVIKKMMPFIIILRVIPRTTGYSHLHSNIETLNMLNAPRTHIHTRVTRVLYTNRRVDGVTRWHSSLFRLNYTFFRRDEKKKFRHCQTRYSLPRSPRTPFGPILASTPRCCIHASKGWRSCKPRVRPSADTCLLPTDSRVHARQNGWFTGATKSSCLSWLRWLKCFIMLVNDDR